MREIEMQKTIKLWNGKPFSQVTFFANEKSFDYDLTRELDILSNQAKKSNMALNVLDIKIQWSEENRVMCVVIFSFTPYKEIIND